MKRSNVIEVDPVAVPRAYQVVARTIGEKVMSGAWQVGMELPGEWALAQAFGVTRSTIREALRGLEQDGLLCRPRGSKQLVIHAPSDVQVSSRMRAAIILQEITFLELWETMMALDTAAAEAAARNASPEHLAALHENQRQTSEALDDPPRLLELDLAFLNGIVAASGNRAIQLCRASISDLLYRAFLPVLRRSPAGARLLVAHQKILAALDKKDALEARRWMERHINDFRRGYERAGLDIHRPVASVGPQR